MKVLGISCGRRMGNTEIMVKEALMGAEEAGAEVQFLRLQDYYIKPCTGCNSCAIDIMEKGGGGACSLKNDDFPFIDDLVMDCDGLVLGSPIYEKSPTGLFKTLEDRMGPSHDQGFRIVAQKIREEKGITTGTGPDPRAFKPRAASLIAVGGSEWDTLALPIMGMFCLTMQMTVVDQILINWIGLPKVVTFHDDKLARVHRSGKHVAESLKKGVENAEYIGEPGMCPLCHCKLIEVRHGNDPYPCICALCGVRGTLTTDADGQVRFTVSDEDRPHSHLLLSGKFEHLQELADVSLKPPANYGEANARSQKYRDYLTPLMPPAREKGKKAEAGEEL
ncbi:MAG: flavodoxin family protein [Actinobacteria bacterium]|nr:flavodoxin family protein [Actinomycetota bacterium]